MPSDIGRVKRTSLRPKKTTAVVTPRKIAFNRLGRAYGYLCSHCVPEKPGIMIDGSVRMPPITVII
jgi:hypothetical protein